MTEVKGLSWDGIAVLLGGAKFAPKIRFLSQDCIFLLKRG